MQEYLIEKNGRRRKAERINCDICNKSFLKRNGWIKEKNYCSNKCFGKSLVTRVEIECWLCKKNIKKKRSLVEKSNNKIFFCSRKCKDIAQSFEGNCKVIQPYTYSNGKASYRERAFKKYIHKCYSCGYDEHIEILEVHHKDGCRENNKLNNLVILCPNCHASLTRGCTILTEYNNFK